jgi:hypothetical protein
VSTTESIYACTHPHAHLSLAFLLKWFHGILHIHAPGRQYATVKEGTLALCVHAYICIYTYTHEYSPLLPPFFQGLAPSHDFGGFSVHDHHLQICMCNDGVSYFWWSFEISLAAEKMCTCVGVYVCMINQQLLCQMQDLAIHSAHAG